MVFRLYQLLTHPNRQSSIHRLPTNMFFFGEFKATPPKKQWIVALGLPTNSPICPSIGLKIHCQPNKLYHVIPIISMLFYHKKHKINSPKGVVPAHPGLAGPIQLAHICVEVTSFKKARSVSEPPRLGLEGPRGKGNSEEDQWEDKT